MRELIYFVDIKRYESYFSGTSRLHDDTLADFAIADDTIS